MIQRRHTTDRMSQSVTHKGVVYLAGQVGTPGNSVAEQTRECLEQVEKLLEEAGSSTKHMLQAIIWMADMKDFAEMNKVWDAWVPKGHAPARATGSADLATPDHKVEVIVTAAVIE
ncbi:RidA family protein [Aliiroseovarius marinus]|jgi:enamine deaminase RidA (YjgF/YER057c/UK114 family)|uniref:RidA family protein n=1 Tax=Aliiroseovarius marinus TaxID=2500159 RepID=UPI00105EBA40|nr:RidA family protein [Aliiroseovarius marinus]